MKDIMADSISNFSFFGYHAVVIDIVSHMCGHCEDVHMQSTITFFLDDDESDTDKAITIFTDIAAETEEELAIETFMGLQPLFSRIADEVTCYDPDGKEYKTLKFSELLSVGHTIQ